MFLFITNQIFFLRHVIIPKEFVKKLPKDRFMTEEEWRAMGIQQSPGWIHYMLHKPGMISGYSVKYIK